jgi:Ras-related protein Rab-1A
MPPKEMPILRSKQSITQSPASSLSERGSMQPEYDYLFKLRLIGDSGVGKSCLLLRFADNTYTGSYISTIGVDFKTTAINIANKIVKLQIWDIAHQERYRNVQSNYYQGAHACILVFDLCDQESFSNIELWRKQQQETNSDLKDFFLFANKSDLTAKRVVDSDVIEEYARLHGFGGVFYTSAKTGENVKAAFEMIAQHIVARLTPAPAPKAVTAPRTGIFSCLSCCFGEEDETAPLLAQKS